MPSIKVATTRPDTIEIEYETFGSPDDPALILVAGFAVQLTSWEAEFCEMLAASRRYVIRFDNRDCGLSTKLDGAKASPQATLSARLSGTELPDVPYTLSDMGNDGIGLLDALAVERAHVAGASMGGMIAQTMAIEHPDRILSLTSIMSSTGDPLVGKPTPDALAVLLTAPPTERQAFIDASAALRGLGVEALRRRTEHPPAGRRGVRSQLLPGGPARASSRRSTPPAIAASNWPD